MIYNQEERQWIISAIDSFKMRIKEDRHNDEEELEYLKSVRDLVSSSEEISTQTVSFIAKVIRLYLKKYDRNISDNISSIVILEGILNKSESFIIKPNIK